MDSPNRAPPPVQPGGGAAFADGRDGSAAGSARSGTLLPAERLREVVLAGERLGRIVVVVQVPDL